MKRSLLLFLLGFARVTYATPDPATALQRDCRDRLCIYFAAEDASLVDQTAATLLSARDELVADLHLTSPDTLRVIIAPTRRMFRDFIQGHLPGWTQAFAIPSLSTMVVRSPRWDRPEASYRQNLVHELLHLLLHQHIGRRELPRWLEEGMALFYAETPAWEQRTMLSRALATGSLIPLSQIDAVLQFQESRAQLAYQQSYSAVRYLLATYDVEALQLILDGVARGEALDALFSQATGSDVAGFEREWQEYLRQSERWLWLSEVDELFWLTLPFLFLIVVWLVRRRSRRRVAEWEAAARAEAWLESEQDAAQPGDSTAAAGGNNPPSLILPQDLVTDGESLHSPAGMAAAIPPVPLADDEDDETAVDGGSSEQPPRP